MPKQIDITAAVERLSAAEKIIITTHVRADGDAIGSALGLRRVLGGVGKDVDVYFHEPVLPRYRFLPDADAAHTWNLDEAASVLAGADLLVVVDTCAVAQLDDMAAVIGGASLARLAIDHHVTRDAVVDEVLLDTSAGACALIIAQLCEAAGWTPDADAATLLYAGLATDTGWFSFSNTDAPVLRVATHLVEAGASPNALYEHLYRSDIEPRVRLVGKVLSTFELLSDGRLAVIRLTRKMMTACGATGKMTEEIINEPQRIGSVEACVLLVEPFEDGPIRVSFRSKHTVDVAAIAKTFGGGGHVRAAGAKRPGTSEEACRRVIPVVLEALGPARK